MKALTKIQLKKVPASQAIDGGSGNKFDALLKKAEGKGKVAHNLMPMVTANIALLAELQH